MVVAGWQAVERWVVGRRARGGCSGALAGDGLVVVAMIVVAAAIGGKVDL